MSAPTLGEAITDGVRRCRHEEAPIPLITESHHVHVTHMIETEVVVWLTERLDQCREDVRANHRWWGYDCTCGVEVQSPDGWTEHLFAVIRDALGVGQ